MNAELRAAAERLIACQYDGDNGEFLRGPNGEAWSRSLDGLAVARAYLAEHSPEPVTAGWLESVLGPRHENQGVSWSHRLYLGVPSLEIVHRHGRSVVGHRVDNRQRREVLGLLAWLKYEPKGNE